ncbi:hypothetical protein BN946_scf185002.g124 [Trametes cinnabarina]|uniref:Uncharacterized protein n=1 Tax=Pycnoporus cinnabarinus TaxID=5643 RepID=A0A060SL49_PYCCI|nr:hypothetical protein BN946_scf185002.g124 [Trametes cinnabarina]
MKRVFAILSLTAVTLAQRVKIVSPTVNTTLSPGDSFVVDIDKADSLSPSYDVSVAIGLESCGTTPCATLASAQILGDVLFSGDFSPQLRPNGSDVFQNYTVQVPPSMASGPAVLSVAHFYLLGAGATPSVDMFNTTVIIE